MIEQEQVLARLTALEAKMNRIENLLLRQQETIDEFANQHAEHLKRLDLGFDHLLQALQGLANKPGNPA